MRCRRAVTVIATVALFALVLAACGGGGDGAEAVRSTRASTSSSIGAATIPTTGAAPAVATTGAPAVTVPPTAPPPAPVASPADRLVGVGNAGQVISVIADGYGQTTAQLTAYERAADGWHQVFGPWTANVGGAGFAPPGEKREGDDRTPSGAYGFDFAFGILADPGVRIPYRVVTSDAIVWNDDSASPRYNLWTDSTTEAAGADPEPMYNAPAYNYGAVIAYNTARTPGLGSAIFLHVSKGGPTAGCVAVPQGQLVDLLRWLDPGRSPRIVMGTRAAITT